MNEFSNRLGSLAQSVGKEYALTAPDDSAALVRRARRGRVVWTGAVGTASLAGAAAVAMGGSAAASSVFQSTAEPAHHNVPVAATSAHDDAPEAEPANVDTVTTSPSPKPSKTSDDDPATHEKAEHAATHTHKAEDRTKDGARDKTDCDGKGDDSGRDHAEDGTHHHKGGDRDWSGDDKGGNTDNSGTDNSGTDDSGTDSSGGSSDD
jgi:hypothetical protein